MNKEEIEELVRKQIEEGLSGLSEMVNKAVTSHKGRIKSELMTAVTETIREQIEAVKPEDDPEGGSGNSSEDDPKPNKAGDDHWKARLEKLETRNRELEEQRVESAKRNAFNKAIEDAKLTGSDLLYPAFRDRIKVTDDGEFVVDDKTLSEAVEEFAGTEDGKRFRPAKPGGGSGAEPGSDQTEGSGSKNFSATDLARRLIEAD